MKKDNKNIGLRLLNESVEEDLSTPQPFLHTTRLFIEDQLIILVELLCALLYGVYSASGWLIGRFRGSVRGKTALAVLGLLLGLFLSIMVACAY